MKAAAAWRFPKDCEPAFCQLMEALDESTPLLRELAQLTAEYLTVLPELDSAFSLQDASTHEQQINALCVLDDGRLVSAHGFRGVGSMPELCTLKVWDLERRCLLRTLCGHQNWIYCVCAFPSSHGRPLIASGSGDKTVKIWDADSNKCVQTVQCSAVVVSITPWGVDQVVAGCHGHVHVISAVSNSCAFSWRVGDDSTCVWSVLKPPLPESAVLCGLSNAQIELWHVRPSPYGAKLLRVFRGHTDVVRSLRWLETNCFASASFDHTCMVWSLSSDGGPLRTMSHGMGLRTLTVLPTGFLVTGAADNKIKVWEPRSGACKFTAEDAHHAPIWTTYVTAHGMLASGSNDNSIKVWHVQLMLR